MTNTATPAHTDHGPAARPRIDSHLHGVGSYQVSDHQVPSGKEEQWRFTPLRRFRDLPGDAVFSGSSLEYQWTGPDNADVSLISEEDQVRTLRRASGFLPTDRSSARILAQTPVTMLADIPADAVLSEPIVITVDGADADRADAGHMLLRCGPRAQADIVLVHTGSACMAELVEVIAGDGAHLSVTAMQEWNADSVHLAHHHLLVGRDATVKHSVLTFGGDAVRISTTVDYAGPGGTAELYGLYYADAGQHLEHRIFVDHHAPHCKSDALYKGALQGDGARTVWVGDVLIRKEAEGTDTYEMNRNLVLTEGARADSVPNLEIETGEIVGAGHASATGRFDDEQLFYLRSRGIPPHVAKRLVVRGFFGEVLLRLGIPLVVDRATEIIERELAITGN